MRKITLRSRLFGNESARWGGIRVSGAAMAAFVVAGCGSTPGGAPPDLGPVEFVPDFALVTAGDLARAPTDGATDAEPGPLPDLLPGPTEATCVKCHGSDNQPAPPKDVTGGVDTARPGVGAHRAHLGPSGWHKEVACAECHVVPTRPAWDPNIPSHLNAVNDITWGPLAKMGTWNRNGLTCAGTYCHGGEIGPDPQGALTIRTPRWTTVDGTQDACGGACHGLPPGGTHPRSQACSLCHGAVIASFRAGNPPQVVWADANRHIDGKLDVVAQALKCTSCHGDAVRGDAAPPLGTAGETLTSDPAVGAHQKHLGPSAWHRPGRCEDCHLVPGSLVHADGKTDFNWGSPSNAQGATPLYNGTNHTCAGAYCHGATLLGPAQGGRVQRAPEWNVVDGRYAACGTTCHTTPPGDTHPQSNQCPLCHTDVIAAFSPGNPPVAVWRDAARHVDGTLDLRPLDCTACHGDPQRAPGIAPAPPRGTRNEMATTDRAVGAHQAHLAPSNWHRDGQCRDCHQLPGSELHTSGTVDFAWGAPSNTDGATPAWDGARVTCNNVYCHGVTLAGAALGGQLRRAPVWTTVNDTFDACGSTCHTNPPGGNHSESNQCVACHGDVISLFVPGNPPQVAWKDAQRHIDGNVDARLLSCTSCHGDAQNNRPEPPLGTKGETLTTQAAVGAHAQHLGPSTWHRAGQCTDCHAVPQSFTHTNGVIDFDWGGPAAANGAQPGFNLNLLQCSNTYCHGNTLAGPIQGGMVNRTPVWNVVNGTFDACGTTCHTLPPAGGHPMVNGNCQACHGKVIAAFVAGSPPQVTWADASLHIDGKIDAANLDCTSCHGDPVAKQPAPPRGTRNEMNTTDRAVGAHRQHLGISTWHREGQCADCHLVPASVTHSNNVAELAFGPIARADLAMPAWSAQNLTCAGSYCHGSTLLGPIMGGAVNRAPVWTQVNGSWDACGTTCHTNPPVAPHPSSENCVMCHVAVIASYDAAQKTATWAAAGRHIDGIVDATKYHDLNGWTKPQGTQTHHGTKYFLANRQRDEHNAPCAQCHGAKLDGGEVGVSCSNANCHPTFNACTFCHGTPPNQHNPPVGVAGETLTNTLAVGRHVAHLTASSTHTAIACALCHAVPPAGDVGHAIDYAPTNDLQAAGHHGDVSFSGGAAGMAWNVNATQGAPVTARGTCIGKCHSNGRGGAPVVTPYWAGGAWQVGSCGTCHAAAPQTSEHSKHRQELPCSGCHPGANTPDHLDGQTDVLGHINGRQGETGVDVVLRGGACGQRPTCNGTCHGMRHGNECW